MKNIHSNSNLNPLTKHQVQRYFPMENLSNDDEDHHHQHKLYDETEGKERFAFSKFERRPRILVKPSFTEMFNSNFSGLRPFDYMAISLS